jgi:NTE family protein
VNTIRNLAFMGGGVECAAYAGAVAVAEAHGVLDTVRNVAGTSAGALTAAILAAGADAAELRHSVVRTSFGRFLDGDFGLVGSLVRLVWEHGMHPGLAFSAILRHELHRLCGHAEITLGEIARRADSGHGHYRRLSVVSSNVTRQRIEVLSAETQPELPVWKAVRMSVSIPLIFVPVRHEGSVYVDGGVGWDYPIELFDARQVPPERSETLGFALGTRAEISADHHHWRSPPQSTSHLFGYLKALGTLLTHTANRAHLRHRDLPCTIFIDDLGVSPADFDAPPATIDALIASGTEAATAYFRQYGDAPPS